MKEDNFKMPSPADLAKKDTTVNISLRVKQSAVDIFNMLAEKEGTKPGTMMITLIEAYANNYRAQIQNEANNSLSTDIMKTYINKMAAKIAKMDKGSLLNGLSKKSIWENITDCGYEGDNIGQLEKDLDSIEKGELEKTGHSNPCVIFGDGRYYALDLWCCKKNIESQIDKGAREKGENYEDHLFLPMDKWYTTVLLFDKYQEKMKAVAPGVEILFTEKMAHDIVDLANKEKDNEKYAKGLANILGKFVEEQLDE